MIYRPQQSKKSNKTLLVTISGFLVVAVIGISVWFIRQQTVTNQHAAASTTLSFTNSTPTAAVGDSISSDIKVDPGTNQVSIVKLSIQYDGSQVVIASGTAGFTVNQTAFPQTLQQPTSTCTGTQCVFTTTVGISVPIQSIQTPTTVGTLHLQALTNGNAQVSFGSGTAAYSTAIGDAASENVISSTTPMTISIGGSGSGNTCVANQSSCSWDSVTGAVSYHYKVIETGSNTTILESDVSAPTTKATFPSQPGNTYTCSVAAIGGCGTGSTGTGTSTCPALTVTPIPSQSPTPTTCSGPGKVSNLHIVCPNCNNQAVNQ